MKVLLLLLLTIAPLPGKTYALLVGISEYSKLPHDLWLQYPDADAASFAHFLGSKAGGSVPAGQIRVLTNAGATNAGVREAFRGLLRDAGKADTVYILIAGHGTVDAQGAYILTYDSDPNDLVASALPMAEVRALVEREVGAAGHVIFLADVCRAATIAGQKTTALGGAVEKLGETPGEMLGLMAARPRELSMEGPEFGGGHGAFTWSVLQGLGGAADTDGDGFVTAGELTDYVTTGVPKITGNKQHPRDFGNIENGTRLAAVARLQ